MQVTGKLNGSLRDLIASLDSAEKGEFLEEFSRQAGDATRELIERGFGIGQDPDGNAWAPTVRGNPPLIRTGALLGSWITVADPTQFGASTELDYPQYHQTGTTRFVARRMVPDDEIPAEWEIEYDRIALEIFDRMFAQAQAA